MMNNIENKPKDLETVEGWLAIARENNNKLAIQIIENLFPELSWSEDERIRRELIKDVEISMPIDTAQKYIAWLEKQSVQKTSWSQEDELIIQDAIHWIQEFQKSDRCKDENDMQNSVTCENGLKNILALCQSLK